MPQGSMGRIRAAAATPEGSEKPAG